MSNSPTPGRRPYGIRHNLEPEFGRRVRVLRETAGRSQESVAKRMREVGHDWHQTTLSKVEQGARGVSLDEAYCLAIVLGQHLRDFLEEAPGELQRQADTASARFFEADAAAAALMQRRHEAEKELEAVLDAIDKAAEKPKQRGRRKGGANG